MNIGDHLRTTGGALKRWFIAQTYDALAVAGLWLIGLLLLGVPWAPLWAFLGGVLQYVPGMGTVLALIGPSIVALFSGGWERLIYVLILYAGIVLFIPAVIMTSPNGKDSMKDAYDRFVREPGEYFATRPLGEF